MNHFGKGIVDNAIAAVVRTKADFNIAATKNKVFVEAANFIEDLTAHQHASARDSEEITIPTSAASEAKGEGRTVGKGMIGKAAHTENDPSVLDEAVGAQEFCAYDTD
jgi:hypothetical protein